MPFAPLRPHRILSHAFVAAVLAVPLFVPAGVQAREFVSIKGNAVNVREQPSTRSATLWELGKGYPLQVQQRRGSWIKVRDFEEPLGWVYAPLTSKTPHRVVTARVANLRAGPGQQHKTVGKLPRHEVVRSLSQSGEWARVQREDGQRGWVAKRLTWGW